MERKFLIASILTILGAIAFLSSYLLIPKNQDRQAGPLIDRFNKSDTVIKNNYSDTTPLSNRKFFSFVNPYSDSKKIVAIDKNGVIVEIGTDNLSERVITTLKQNDLSEVFLSPNGSLVVYSLYDMGGNKKYFYLNLREGGSAEINYTLKSAVFSPRGDQVVYFINNGSEGELLLSKNNDSFKKILKTRLDNAIIAWPSDFVSIISYDKDGYGDLFTLNEMGELNKIISYQRNLNAKWSLSAEKFVFSAKNKTGSDYLFYRDPVNSGPDISLDVNTDTSKCVWLKDDIHIICGVLDRTSLKDVFYKINTADGSRAVVSTPSINLITKDLAISQSGDTIFILNDIDSKLYALEIK